MAIYGMTTSDEWWTDRVDRAKLASQPIELPQITPSPTTMEDTSTKRFGMPGEVRGKDIFGNPRNPGTMETRMVGEPIKKENF